MVVHLRLKLFVGRRVFLNNTHLEERYNIDGAAQNNGIGVMGQSMDSANVERIPAEFSRRQERNNAVLAHVV